MRSFVWCRSCGFNVEPKHRCVSWTVGPFGGVAADAAWHRSQKPPKIIKKGKKK